MGALELAYRQLFEKLQAEGLFDDDRKKEIPRYARRIGIVTSATGAAVRDIIQIARRRNPSVELILHPAQVQGDGAENTIATGIRYFNTRDDIDVLIVGRGGGSIEDLWPFNTDITVRAIAASKIPVISAVGHEVDFTLADYAADMPRRDSLGRGGNRGLVAAGSCGGYSLVVTAADRINERADETCPVAAAGFALAAGAGAADGYRPPASAVCRFAVEAACRRGKKQFRKAQKPAIFNVIPLGGVIAAENFRPGVLSQPAAPQSDSADFRISCTSR